MAYAEQEGVLVEGLKRDEIVALFPVAVEEAPEETPEETPAEETNVEAPDETVAETEESTEAE